MTDITALTFVRGELTNARRTSPIPQLECVSGSARYDSSVQPQTVQCVNVGNDGKNVQWKCDANLDNKVKFGKLVVSCEGYSHKDDPYVLVGSCGLRYGLDYENGANQGKPHSQSTPRHYYDDTVYNSGSWSTTIFDFVFYGLVVAFFYYLVKYMFAEPRYAGNMPGAGYGANPYGQGYGQGYGGNPYPGYGASSTFGAYPSYGTSYGAYPSTGGGWWSGFATGGLLGSLWNRPSYGYRSGYATPSYSTRSYGGSSFSSGSSFSGPSSRRSTGHATSETR